MIIRKCDRCLTENAGRSALLHTHMCSGYAKSGDTGEEVIFELCYDCFSELKRFFNGCSIETSFRRGPRETK